LPLRKLALFRSPLNLTFWWCEIPSRQVRYTEEQDAILASRVVKTLREGNLYIDEPQLLNKIVKRSRRVEIWIPRESKTLNCP